MHTNYNFRGPFDFGSVKKYLSRQDHAFLGENSRFAQALDYALHFRRWRGAAGLQGKHGGVIPAATLPLYSRDLRALEQLGTARENMPPASPPKAPAPPATEEFFNADAITQAYSPPALDEEPLPSSGLRRRSTMLQIALPIVVAIGVGAAIVYSSSTRFKLQGPSTLPPPTAIAEPQPSPAITPPAFVPPTPSTQEEQTPLAVTPELHPPTAKPAPKRLKKPKRKRAKPPAAQPSPSPQAPEPEHRFPGDSPSFEARTRSTRLALAKCQNKRGVISRERCKWRICSHRWGKNGCPDYSQKNGQVILGTGLWAWRP